MKKRYLFGLILGLCLNTMGLRNAAVADDSWVEQYNVTWNTHSENSSGSGRSNRGPRQANDQPYEFIESWYKIEWAK